MKVDILTLFPEMFNGPFATSMLKKAQDKKLVEIKIHNLRNWAKDKHKTVDDRPYGGGVGMIMKFDVIDRAIEDIKNHKSFRFKDFQESETKIKKKKKKIKTILLSAKGKPFNQRVAQKLSKFDHLILIAGHYEGVDERVAEHLVDEEISIGDFILTGGEIPAMVLTDAIVRLIPGVLEKPEATNLESFSPSTIHHTRLTLLEYPQYTRPVNYKDWKVPKILLSGNHKLIDNWRRQESLAKTKRLRPDLLKNKDS